MHREAVCQARFNAYKRQSAALEAMRMTALYSGYSSGDCEATAIVSLDILMITTTVYCKGSDKVRV